MQGILKMVDFLNYGKKWRIEKSPVLRVFMETPQTAWISTALDE
jgi:hypothetical protein